MIELKLKGNLERRVICSMDRSDEWLVVKSTALHAPLSRLRQAERHCQEPVFPRPDAVSFQPGWADFRLQRRFQRRCAEQLGEEYAGARMQTRAAWKSCRSEWQPRLQVAKVASVKKRECAREMRACAVDKAIRGQTWMDYERDVDGRVSLPPLVTA
jgi:hypothetical protein